MKKRSISKPKPVEMIDVAQLFPKDPKKEIHIIHHHPYSFLKARTNLNNILEEKIPSFNQKISNLTDIQNLNNIESSLVTLLDEKNMTVYYQINELGRIWFVTSPEEIFIAYIIPAIVESYYLSLKNIKDDSEKIFFIGNTLTNLCRLIVQLACNQFELFFEKFSTELLSQAKNSENFENLGHCELFFINILSLPEERLKSLEEQLTELSYALSATPSKSEVINKFLEKYPFSYKYKHHPFYYYLKQIKSPYQQTSFIAAYEKCFESNKVKKQPIVDWILGESEEFIIDFIDATLKNIETTQNTDVKAKFKSNVLIALIEAGFYHEKFMDYTQDYPKIIKKIFDENYHKLESIYLLFSKKNVEKSNRFLQISAEQYPEKKTAIKKKYPDIFPTLQPPDKIFYKQKSKQEIKPKPVQQAKSSATKKTDTKVEPKIVIKKEKRVQRTDDIRQEKYESSSNANHTSHKKTHHTKSTLKQKASSFANRIINNTLPTIIKPLNLSRPVSKAISYATIATPSTAASKQPETIEPSIKQSISPETKPILFNANISAERSQIIHFFKSHLDNKSSIIDEVLKNLNINFDENSKLSILIFLLKDPRISKEVVETFNKQFTTHFVTDITNYFSIINISILEHRTQALESLNLFLFSEKLSFEYKKNLQSYLFNAATEKNILFLFGKLLEENFFPLSASVFFLLSNSSHSRESYLNIKNKYRNINVITDFLAVTNDKQIIIKNMLLDQNNLCTIQARILRSYQKKDISVIDCLEAFHHHLKIIANLFNSGWAAEKALSIFTILFNALVNLLMNLEILLPAIVQSENLGHIFCSNLANLLRKMSTAEYSCRAYYGDDMFYVKSLNLYLQAFVNQTQRIGCSTPAPDTHFAAYFQLMNSKDRLTNEFIQKIIHLGKFEAIVFAADLFSPHDFCERVIRPEVKNLTNYLSPTN